MKAPGSERALPGAESFPHWSDRDHVERAIEKLRSTHDSDRGLSEIIACGKEAIPALHELLFAREPGGRRVDHHIVARAFNGVIGVLGAFRRFEAILHFIAALADDESRRRPRWRSEISALLPTMPCLESTPAFEAACLDEAACDATLVSGDGVRLQAPSRLMTPANVRDVRQETIHARPWL